MTNTNQSKVAAGSIMVSSWGYDQTNVDFYLVTKVSPSGKTVTLAHLTNKIVGKLDDTRNEVMPGDLDLDGKVITRRVDAAGAVQVETFERARLWTGRREWETAGWAGH